MHDNKPYDLSLFNRLCVILLAVLLAGIFLLSLKRQFGQDEFEAVHTAWKMLAGEKIYQDFFQHHHPFFYYCLTAPVAMFGENASTLVFIRLICLTIPLLTMFVTYRFCTLIFNNKRISLIAVVLLSGAFIFVDSSIEIRPDVPQTLFAMLSFYFLFSHLDSKRLTSLILSAVCLGVSFLFLQKAIFAAAVIGTILLVALLRKNISLKQLAIFIGVLLLTLLPYYIYLIATDSLETYWTFNWLLNMRFMNRFSALDGFVLMLKSSTLLVIFYVLGIVRMPRTTNGRRVVWASLGLIGSVLLVRAPYNQYFMLALPFMAIIAANALWSVFTAKSKLAELLLIVATTVALSFIVYKTNGQILLVALTTLVGLLILLAWLFYLKAEVKRRWLPYIVLLSMIVPATEIFNRSADINGPQLALVDYVLSVTEPGDHVYDGNVTFNLFRKDIDYFWYSVRPGKPYGALTTYQRQIADYHYDVYESIDRFKPKVIGPFYIDTDDPRIKADYVESDVAGGIYLRKD